MNQPRYDCSLRYEDIVPYRTDGLCRCGCGQLIQSPRRCWATDACGKRHLRDFQVKKGYTAAVRGALRERDRGRCARCRLTVVERKQLGRAEEWEGHHVVPVAEGGGGCGLEGYETLCVDCHRAETQTLATRLAQKRRDAAG